MGCSTSRPSNERWWYAAAGEIGLGSRTVCGGRAAPARRFSGQPGLRDRPRTGRRPATLQKEMGQKAFRANWSAASRARAILFRRPGLHGHPPGRAGLRDRPRTGRRPATLQKEMGQKAFRANWLAASRARAILFRRPRLHGDSAGRAGLRDPRTGRRAATILKEMGQRLHTRVPPAPSCARAILFPRPGLHGRPPGRAGLRDRSRTGRRAATILKEMGQRLHTRVPPAPSRTRDPSPEARPARRFSGQPGLRAPPMHRDKRRSLEGEGMIRRPSSRFRTRRSAGMMRRTRISPAPMAKALPTICGGRSGWCRYSLKPGTKCTIAGQTGKFDRAEERLRESLWLDPQACEPLFSLGGVRVTLHKVDEGFRSRGEAPGESAPDGSGTLCASATGAGGEPSPARREGGGSPGRLPGPPSRLAVGGEDAGEDRGTAKAGAHFCLCHDEEACSFPSTR
jgi:hypothetical protein